MDVDTNAEVFLVFFCFFFYSLLAFNPAGLPNAHHKAKFDLNSRCSTVEDSVKPYGGVRVCECVCRSCKVGVWRRALAAACASAP